MSDPESSSASNPQDPDPAAEQAAREKEAAEQAALPYKWKQTIGDVDVSVPVPKGSRARDLVVEIKKLRLKVGVKGQEPIIDVCGLPWILLFISHHHPKRLGE